MTAARYWDDSNIVYKNADAPQTALRVMRMDDLECDLAALKYPLFASPKIDGVRCAIANSRAYTRTFRQFPNKYIQELFKDPALNGLDGELIAGRNPMASNLMQLTTSAVMSHNGRPTVTFWVFDRWDRGLTVPYAHAVAQNFSKPHASRIEAGSMHDYLRLGIIQIVPQRLVNNAKELLSWRDIWLKEGYEGLVGRSMDCPYKNGRVTSNEGYLFRIKPKTRSEAMIIAVNESTTNTNEATLDERGYTKRSSHKANKVPTGSVGSFTCMLLDRNLVATGVTFNMGVFNGVTEETCAKWWKVREKLIGKVVSFDHLAHSGVKEKPRHPVFIAFRSPLEFKEV